MKNTIKKFISIAMSALTLMMVFTACGSKPEPVDYEQLRVAAAEEIFQRFYMDDESPEIYWDKYISKTTKNLGVTDRESFCRVMGNVQNDTYIVSPWESTEIEQIDENYYKVTFENFTIVIEGEEIKNVYHPLYIIVEDGVAKEVYMGETEKYQYSNLQYDTDDFTVNNVDVIKSEDGIKVEIAVKSDFHGYVSFGNPFSEPEVEPTYMIIETEDGNTYQSTMENLLFLTEEGEEGHSYAEFEYVYSKPVKITIGRIFLIDYSYALRVINDFEVIL